jgi:hypothetical protein
MNLHFTRQSRRLWTAEHEGRHFRLEKPGTSHAGAGGMVVREVDELHRNLQKEYVPNLPAARKLAGQWSMQPKPTEPMRADSTKVKDLTLGVGPRFGSPRMGVSR